jgi:hypothetical protein
MKEFAKELIIWLVFVLGKMEMKDWQAIYLRFYLSDKLIFFVQTKKTVYVCFLS